MPLLSQISQLCLKVSGLCLFVLVNQWRTQEFCLRGGGSSNSVEDRGQGSGDSSPLVRGSGGSCNFIQEISFHMVKIFLIFGTLRLFMMTTNLFVIANVKQLRT